MNVVFLHPVFTAEALAGHDVPSQAANVWCRSLYDEMVRQKINLSLVGHVPARIWPLGKRFFLSQGSGFSADFMQTNVPYINFPLLRTVQFRRGYRSAVRRLLENDRSSVVCTYNPLPWQVSAASEAVSLGHSWISFVLDEDSVSTDGWGGYMRKTEAAKGHVFISKWAFDHAPVDRKFFFEGGVPKWNGREMDELSEIPSFLFCGQIGDATSPELFREILEVTRDMKYELWVAGRGQESLRPLAVTDSRLKLLGFLTEDELHRRMRLVWGFLNLRSCGHRGTNMNFPSKLFLYLSYGKPIISMAAPGVPEYYGAVIRFLDAVPINAEREMRRVLDLSIQDRKEFYGRCRRFVTDRCALPEKVGKLLGFMESAQ